MSRRSRPTPSGGATIGLGALLRRLRDHGAPNARSTRPVRRELGLIGLDVAERRTRRDVRLWLPVLALALAAGLAVAVLRTDLIRHRYALANATLREQSLQAEQRALTAELRALRDPLRLTERAAALGFVRPTRVIDLPGAEPENLVVGGADTVLADVGPATKPGSGNRP